jgi:uncharacterized oxidoreductase
MLNYACNKLKEGFFMKLSGHHVLITGGTTGIGLGLAKAFIEAGSSVLVVDFDNDHITKAKADVTELQTYQADLSKAGDREKLAQWITDNDAELDVLINNAGIQRWINLNHLDKSWEFYHQELAINLEAQLHLIMLLLKQINQNGNGAIINVSSGLVINPGSWVPLYTASKFGVHGFTQALRWQMEDESTKVFEIFPPAVNTSLGGASEHTYGVSLDEFIPAVMQQIEADNYDITYGTSKEQYDADKATNRKQDEMVWHMFKDNPTFKNA